MNPLGYIIIVCLCLLGTGVYLLFLFIQKKQNKAIDDRNGSLNKLKSNGEKIQIDFEHCIFKSSNFQQESTDRDPSAIQVYDSLLDSARNHTAEQVNQAVIIYTYINGNTTEKFISQNFPVDLVTLKYYVTNGKITLYVDRFSRDHYFFCLETA